MVPLSGAKIVIPCVSYRKKVIRTITHSNYIAHSEPLLKDLNLLNVRDLMELKIIKFLHKLYHNNLPVCFNDYMPHLESREGSARPEVRGIAEPHGGAYPP